MNTTETMTVTLTTSYKDFLTTQSVEKVEELLGDNYSLDDMLEFIDTYNETDFVNYYEEYVRCGESIGYEAVDALIGENGECSCIQDCDDRYRGVYESTADFAEQFVTDVYGEPESILVIDWEATWDSSLRYDYTACEKGYREVHIFSDYW